MALEDILRALDKKAEAEVKVIQESALQRVDEIKSEVELSVSRARRLKLKKLEESVRSDCAALLYSASLKAKNNVIKAQENVVDTAFKIAEERLQEINKDASYPKVLEALLDGCLEYIEEDVVIEARPEDRELVEKMMASKGLAFKFLETPLEVSGGLVAKTTDDEIIVMNTFESRMDRAKESLKLDISNTLFGAPE
ncbi:MAG: V-type ATP synthase subunit E [Actinobacteria bacterium]|nr:V-type ATP synthase subunit E [Actinomycetota bacterium]